MEPKTIGFAVCGSFCTHSRALAALEQVAAQYEHVIPIVSEIVSVTLKIKSVNTVLSCEYCHSVGKLDFTACTGGKIVYYINNVGCEKYSAEYREI